MYVRKDTGGIISDKLEALSTAWIDREFGGVVRYDVCTAADASGSGGAPQKARKTKKLNVGELCGEQIGGERDVARRRIRGRGEGLKASGQSEAGRARVRGGICKGSGDDGQERH